MFKALIQLAGASFIAQAISFLVMPAITRMHTPESLGEYQIFTTLALIITPFVTGSFGDAIRGSRSKHQAFTRLKVASQYSVLAFLLLLLLIPIFLIIAEKLSQQWLSPYTPILLFFIFLSANFQFAMAFYNNEKQYARESTYTLTKSVTSSSLRLFFSFFSASGMSLVLALIITEVFQLFRVAGTGGRKFLRRVYDFNWEIFKRRFAKLRIYPTYVSFTAAIGILMNWFPILVTGILYGTHFAGLLGLAFMVVNTPVYPLISALRSVCFGELAREKTHDKLIIVYSKIMLLAAFAGVCGLVVLGFYGQYLFSFIFGDEWREAGLYAFICFIPVFLSLLLSPVYDTLNHFFSFQRAFFFVKLFSLFFGLSVTGYLGFNSFDFYWFIVGFAVVMSIMHLLLFLTSLTIIKSSKKLIAKQF